jgi:hypothetical protein
LKVINVAATQMVAALKKVLDPDNFLASPAEVKALQGQLEQQASLILHTNQTVLEKAAATQDAVLREDLSRMRDSAQRMVNLIGSALSFDF